MCVCVCGGGGVRVCVWGCVCTSKTIFGSCDLHKGQRSNLSMQKIFSMPKVYNCQIWFETF